MSLKHYLKEYNETSFFQVSLQTHLHKFVESMTTGRYKSVRFLNPREESLQTWNKVFLLSCAFALAVDPLFYYIPVVDGQRKCLDFDIKMGIVAFVLRTFIDVLYIIHITFQLCTTFIAKSTHTFDRGEFIDNSRVIARRYLCYNFFIDILAILPIPQIIVMIPSSKGLASLVTKEWFKCIILWQYVPRVIRIVPLFKQVTSTSGIFSETAWAGAALKLFLYMLASHGIGALWYFISIQQQHWCWRNAIDTYESVLYCNKHMAAKNNTLVNLLSTRCAFTKSGNIKDLNAVDFGMFNEALESGILETWNFRKKLYYCFWWGLRNLISFGQNLKTSTIDGEILFALAISVGGLILFSLLIGNMQKYLESTGVRLDEMRVKRKDAEQWMSQRKLPEKLRERIRRYEQYKWQETRGVEEDTLISNLPKDLRRDVKRHLCLDILRKVPLFSVMDEQLLDAICDRLKSVLYTDNSYIFREGDPVEEMLFIIRGHLYSYTTDGGRNGFFNDANLKAGDFCGEELLTWALDPRSPSNLPNSTRTVQALQEVEAFALMADDLKFVASQFRLTSKQFQHTLRFYSVQWRTWGASFIQAAWRRHSKRKIVKSLRQEALARESGSSTSLGATIYASRFAVNALQSARLPQRLLPLLPQKPADSRDNHGSCKFCRNRI